MDRPKLQDSYCTQTTMRPWRLFGLAVILTVPYVPTQAQTIQFKRVSQETIEARLKVYLGDDKQREQTLRKLFAEAGCDEQHLTEQPVKSSKLPNLICTLPGSSDKVFILGAHYDHVFAGDGVVDNWSGASLLPSLYEGMKVVTRKHTFIFIAFTAEEQGEIGSHFYATHMKKTEIAATDAMINMDTLGLAPTQVWASHSDRGLVGVLSYVAKQMNMPLSGANVDDIGSTDSVQFSKRKIRSITIHSLTQENWNQNILHTSKDRMSAIRLDDYYQTYRLIAAYLAFLDGIPTSQPAK
jgi:putative aminopeptidase FrvX